MSDTEAKLTFHDQLLYPRDPIQTRQWYVDWANKYEEVSRKSFYNL